MFSDRFRPKTLQEVIGNDSVRQSLENYLSNGNLPHTLLLEGQYGGGKTTIARIIADRLNATVTEHDCGADGDIGRIREIVDSADYGALFSDKKVIILDEVQKLSAAAQQVLLKTTEEPGEDLYYIMCTTDPEKISPALKSRAVRLKITPVNREGIRSAYRRVREETNITLEGGTEDWDKIIESSEGSLRVVYNTLDKVVAAGEKRADGVYVSTATLDSLLGILSEEDTGFTDSMPLPQAFMRKELIPALEAISQAKKDKKEPMGTLLGLYNYLKKAKLKQSQAVLADMAEILMDPVRANNWYALEFIALKHL